MSGFFDGIIKTAGTLGSTLPVVGGAIQAGADVLGGSGSGQRSIASPCPGTPPNLAADVAARLNADPSLADALRSFISGSPPPDKDWQQLQSVWGTPEGLASGAVWTAWGGGECKVGSREAPLQAELNRISRLPLPASAGGSPTLSTTASGSGIFSGISTLGLVVIVALFAGGAFLLARSK